MNNIKSNNSKFFDLMVNDLFFSKDYLKKESLSLDPFYSDTEKKLKETIKKLNDQRCLGYININLVNKDKKTAYIQQHREQGSLKARLIKNYNVNDELIIINTAGGVTSGDVNVHSIKVAKNVILNITTQSMEKIYKCKNLCAHTYTNIVVDSNSFVSWLPLETIFFDGAKLRRRINIELKKKSNFLGVETLIFGRKAMGEIVKKGDLDDAWQIYKNGELIYSDFNKINGNINYKFSKAIIMKGNNILCNVVFTGSKIKTYKKKILDYINNSNFLIGVSLLNGVLLLKILAQDLNEIRGFLKHLMNVLDDRFNLPRIWGF